MALDDQDKKEVKGIAKSEVYAVIGNFDRTYSDLGERGIDDKGIIKRLYRFIRKQEKRIDDLEKRITDPGR